MRQALHSVNVIHLTERQVTDLGVLLGFVRETYARVESNSAVIDRALVKGSIQRASDVILGLQKAIAEQLTQPSAAGHTRIRRRGFLKQQRLLRFT
jgi:hypothetical protein